MAINPATIQTPAGGAGGFTPNAQLSPMAQQFKNFAVPMASYMNAVTAKKQRDTENAQAQAGIDIKGREQAMMAPYYQAKTGESQSMEAYNRAITPGNGMFGGAGAGNGADKSFLRNAMGNITGVNQLTGSTPDTQMSELTKYTSPEIAQEMLQAWRTKIDPKTGQPLSPEAYEVLSALLKEIFGFHSAEELERQLG